VAYTPHSFFVDGAAQKMIDFINSQVRSSAPSNVASSLNRDRMMKATGSSTMSFLLIKTDGQPGTVSRITDALKAQFKNAIPVRIDSTQTVIN
jgi:hypothetical protein